MTTQTSLRFVLAQLRRAKNIKEIAQKTGVSTEYIYMMRNGQRSPSLATLMKLEDYFLGDDE